MWRWWRRGGWFHVREGRVAEWEEVLGGRRQLSMPPHIACFDTIDVSTESVFQLPSGPLSFDFY